MHTMEKMCTGKKLMREDKGGGKLENYPAIKPERRTGSECLVDANNVPISTLQDFCSWAYSDLISNTERGVFAEFLVACALGINHKTRISWDPFDLFCPEDPIVDGRKYHSETIQNGIRIEVNRQATYRHGIRKSYRRSILVSEKQKNWM